MPDFPLVSPNPPRLSRHVDALERIERSGVFSNNGPEVRAFEAEITDQLFGGRGATLAVNNATIGLMVAIRQAAGDGATGRFALMPTFTFAATAQAAIWAGLTPLLCDIDPEDWAAAPAAEEALLERYGDQIAVVVPYATFGNAIDLDRYRMLQRRYGVGVVIDAAASLGTTDDAGVGFAADAPFATVFSMHATKTFAVAEGGLIHSGDAQLIESLRATINFGFTRPRSAGVVGLNAKLPEVLALMARLKLAEIGPVVEARSAVETAYRDMLIGFDMQRPLGNRRAPQFFPILLPATLKQHRDAIIATLAAQGIGAGHYFSPHLGQQPLFREQAVSEPTPVANDVGARMLSLPIADTMTAEDARTIAAALTDACATVRPKAVATPRRAAIAEVVVVGGGPAGTALLTAASKQGRLADVSRGLVMIEREHELGGGRLGRYGITSDSTAETFLSAVKDNPWSELAELEHHPVGRRVARYSGALGVPLVEAGPLVRETGRRLGRLVEAHGGTLLTGHEVIDSRRGDGLWHTRVRCLDDGQERELLSRHLVIATGGRQPLDRLARERVAGEPLMSLAGERLMQSDSVLAQGGMERVQDLLSGKPSARIAVIGGSTSALATIALLLKAQPTLPLGAGAVTLLHRRPLRPFYPTPEAAHADGFTDFDDRDICPVSGFVYRLAGFRLEARELVLRLLQVNGRVPEPRVTHHQIAAEDDGIAREIIAGADLVIAALGYRPHALPLREANGSRIALATDNGSAMVDRHCRVLDGAGRPLPGVYGLGLAAGFVPWGAMGGEPSFRGQANGLWQWQNPVGGMILEQLLGARAEAAA